MLNYSLITNNYIKEINTVATEYGADSFIGDGGTASSTLQNVFSNIGQNDTVIITHGSNASGIIAQVYELQVGSGLYHLQDVANYTVSNKSDTITTVTKVSSGTATIKVNILLA
jgi:hypothetical protein